MTDLFDVCEATWPPKRTFAVDGITFRDGASGGKRVSAASSDAPLDATALAKAEDQMRGLGQTPLFQLKDTGSSLDQALDARGYAIVDPVNFYLCPVSTLLTIPRPKVSGFAIWEPLAIMQELWAEGGIGPGRIDVMRRAAGPKTAILGRVKDRPAGVAFVAIHERTAMLHALEVTPTMRRNGVARTIMGHAGHWAAKNGADQFSVIVTKANDAANRLYRSLGMEIAGHYHYRVLHE